MKRINRILSFLTVICCLAGSVLPAYSARADDSDSVPRVVFTNRPNPLPGLRVTKNITNPEDYTEGELESLRFSFTLKLDDKTLTKEVSYKKKDSFGNIIKDANGNEITYWTVDHGVFEIGPGETAWFKDIESGRKYEVEENKDDNGKCECVKVTVEDGEEEESELDGYFRQKLPEANANAVGHIAADGSSETFENEYYPAGEGEKTTLHISKSSPFLSGYTSIESPEFTFTIKIRNKPYADEPFSIVDAKENPAGDGKTDENGQFRLKAGYTAEFKDIDAEVDYEVKEETGSEMPEGWWPIDKTVWNGATEVGDMHVDFSNGHASFAVSKKVKDGAGSDVEFAFELTGEDGSLWRQAKYYLYNESDKNNPLPVEEKEPAETDEPADINQPADTEPLEDTDQPEEKEQPVDYVHMTGDDGRFTLKSGQVAIFIGIEPGTKYNVREITNPAWENEDWWKKGEKDYLQVTPENKEGYTGQEASNSVLPLEFVNKEVKYTSTLSVKKLIENLKNDAPEDLETREFQFVLESRKLDASGNPKDDEEFEPVKGADYTLTEGGKELNGQTGKGEEDGGKFTLKANATASFKSLPRGYEYRVSEITDGLAKDGYSISGGAASQSGVLKKNSSDNVTLAFTNQYSADKLDLNLTKTNRAESEEKAKKLAGAEFTLWKVKPEAAGEAEEPVDGEEEDKITPTESDIEWESLADNRKIKVGSYTTDAEGKLAIPGLESGTYFLEETKAPLVYRLWDEPLKIVIMRQRDAEGEPLTVTVDNATVESNEAAEAPNGDKVHEADVTGNLTDPSRMVGGLKLTLGKAAPDNTRDTVDLTVYNNPPYELPNSGGTGIFLYVIAGIVLMMAASYLYWKKIRVQTV